MRVDLEGEVPVNDGDPAGVPGAELLERRVQCLAERALEVGKLNDLHRSVRGADEASCARQILPVVDLPGLGRRSST
ncbi:MAG: hypothetical protein M3P24_09060, partial [Gemmatimonadota bacterium]|nr:hypothetical protein [Gemmatimonadota bacterium]